MRVLFVIKFPTAPGAIIYVMMLDGENFRSLSACVRHVMSSRKTPYLLQYVQCYCVTIDYCRASSYLRFKILEKNVCNQQFGIRFVTYKNKTGGRSCTKYVFIRI